MKQTIKSSIIPAALALSFIPTLVAAQDIETRTGRVVEIFGSQFVLESQGTRFLIQPDTDTGELPKVGDRITVTGEREGSTLRADQIETMAALASAGGEGEAELPQQLQGLALGDVSIRTERDGDTKISAKLPNGDWIRAETNEAGGLEEIETNRNGALTAELLSRILPESLLQSPRFQEIDRVQEIEIDKRKYEVEGFSADGARIEIKADLDGRLIEFEMKRDDDDRVALSEEAARASLEKLGYTDFGWVEAKKKHVHLEARNSFGERVEVHVNANGQVTKERLLGE